LVDAARYALLVYGILMIVGGILGYVLPKTPSKISLIAGVASGVLAIVCYFIARSEPTPGLSIGIVVSAGVGIMMLPRVKTAKKPQSVVMIVALSFATAALAAAALVF
jgi:uncharacterized membrane protein (UPF0136 family)